MSVTRPVLPLMLLLLLVAAVIPGSGYAAAPQNQWYRTDDSGMQRLSLYFFWSARCPHCQEARPVVERWEAELPWLEVQARELTRHPEYLNEYAGMAARFGREARSVPAFFYCGKMVVGFDNEAGMGRQIRQELEACYRQRLEGEEPDINTEQGAADIPLLGTITPGEHSLLLVTAVIAALDAFNPCAFFVLLFLLSLLIHTRSRQRMLFIGGVFIFFSGAIYFLFMAAWLNLFLVLGMQQLFTIAAGGGAILLALVNIKDFFLPGKGFSLSMTTENRSGLFQRMRGLLLRQNMVAVTLATIALAIAANSYELLCTSGLPMVYTRILTLESLSTGSYYLYLLLYNLIYVLPLLLILLLFTFTLGQRKLQPEEGRLLKLLSGTMMFELGVGLLWKPELLNSVGVVVVGMLSAVGVSAVAWYLLRRRSRRRL